MEDTVDSIVDVLSIAYMQDGGWKETGRGRPPLNDRQLPLRRNQTSGTVHALGFTDVASARARCISSRLCSTQDYGFAVAYLDHLFGPPKDCSGLRIRHHHKWLSSDRFFTQTDPYHRTGSQSSCAPCEGERMNRCIQLHSVYWTPPSTSHAEEC